MQGCAFVAKQGMQDFSGIEWWICHARSCDHCRPFLNELREQLWRLLFGGKAPILPEDSSGE